MFGLGAGLDTPALHNPDYDFPDELIDTGVQLFGGIIDQFLAQPEADPGASVVGLVDLRVACTVGKPGA